MDVAKNDFWVQGPSVVSKVQVLIALFALQYLPDNFKLVLPGSEAADKGFLAELQTLVARDNLHNRVRFASEASNIMATIQTDSGSAKVVNGVVGDSPEALASAILLMARSRV